MSHEHTRPRSYVTELVDRMMARIELSDIDDDPILTAMRKKLVQSLTCLNMTMTVEMKSVAREYLCAQWAAIVMSIGFDMEYYRRIRQTATPDAVTDGRIIELRMCYLNEK